MCFSFIKLENIKKYILKNWHEKIVIIFAVIFFLFASSFNFLTQNYAQDQKQIDFVKWVSPDETANYIFTKLYAQTNNLSFYEKYNLIVQDIMHPRSVRSDFGVLKPTSFLGIILIYGKMASLFGYQIIPYLTPLLASIGLIFFYLLLKEIFDKTNALISTLLLSCFPVYLYYSSRSMFHNVPLTVFFIISLYFVTQTVKKRDDKKKYLSMICASLAGFFTGLSLITRASEIWWILLVIFLIWIFYIKEIGFTKLLLFISFCFLAILPMFYYNIILYGGPFFGGYTEMNQSIMEISQASLNIVNNDNTENINSMKELLKTIKNNIFYFGFHPDFSFIMLKRYFVEMFYYLFWPACLGMFFFLLKINQWQKKHFLYFLAYFSLSTILIIYYGSWEFHDNPDPSSFTIGNSYTRYWLPVYAGVLPMAAYAITKFSEYTYEMMFFCIKKTFKFLKFKLVVSNKFFSFYLNKKVYKFVLSSFIIFVIFFISIAYFLFGSEEGIIYTIEKQKIIKNEWEKVLDLTSHNSVLITKYHDKIFFPERKVIIGGFSDLRMVEEYANIAEYLPVYYYNFTLPKDALDWLNNSRLKSVGLRIEKKAQITSDFSLYYIFLAD